MQFSYIKICFPYLIYFPLDNCSHPCRSQVHIISQGAVSLSVNLAPNTHPVHYIILLTSALGTCFTDTYSTCVIICLGNWLFNVFLLHQTISSLSKRTTVVQFLRVISHCIRDQWDICSSNRLMKERINGCLLISQDKAMKHFQAKLTEAPLLKYSKTFSFIALSPFRSSCIINNPQLKIRS